MVPVAKSQRRRFQTCKMEAILGRQNLCCRVQTIRWRLSSLTEVPRRANKSRASSWEWNYRGVQVRVSHHNVAGKYSCIELAGSGTCFPGNSWNRAEAATVSILTCVTTWRKQNSPGLLCSGVNLV